MRDVDGMEIKQPCKFYDVADQDHSMLQMMMMHFR